MDNIYAAIIVAIAIPYLSILKCLWHGIQRKSFACQFAHAVCLGILSAKIGNNHIGIPVLITTVLALIISNYILDHNPRLKWWWIKRKLLFGQDAFHLVSMLSSLPAQASAATAVLYSLWLSNVDSRIILAFFVVFVAEALLIKFVMWRHPKLIPTYWR